MEFKQQRAIYLQIADYICEKILQQQWSANEKISSIRELAIEVVVNPNTVVKAYDYLESQGIIYTQRGIGYFVMQDAVEKIINLKKTSFFRDEIPWFFKNLQLLQIDFTQIQNLYEQFKLKMRAKNEN